MAEQTDRASMPHGMRPSETRKLCELIAQFGCRRILEIGMANASSTIVLLNVIKDVEGAHIVSIDPFQFEDASNEGESYDVRGVGVRNVENSGLSHLHTLIAEFDYVAMPRLVAEGRKFDAIFIDGYHSFDYTFLDMFYADLLLTDGGLVLFHDTDMPAVHKAFQFFVRNKPYTVIGPRPVIYTKDFGSRVARKLTYLATGRMPEIRERQQNWGALAALQKKQTAICPQGTIASF
jgi:predicted O-methyltransferase YrrM